MKTSSRGMALQIVHWTRALSTLSGLVAFAIAAPLDAQPSDLRVRQISPEGAAFTDVPPDTDLHPVSPDGKWIVFYADVETDDVAETYSVRRFGGTPIRLSAIRPPGSELPRQIAFSGDSRRVILWNDQETIGRLELWSVPIDGPAVAAIKLNPPTPLSSEVSEIQLSGDGRHVAFVFAALDGGREIFSAPVDGSAAAVRISPDRPPGSAGLSSLQSSAERLFFLGDYGTPGRVELWSAPFDGAESTIRLSGSLQVSGDVDEFAIAPDGQRVLYRANQRFANMHELFSVPASGPFSAAVRVSPDLSPSGAVQAFRFSSDGTRAVMLADVTQDEELWSVPVQGPSEAAVRLSPTLPPGARIERSTSDFEGIVAYRADPHVDDQIEAFLVPIHGPSSASVAISGSIVAGGDVRGVAVFPGLEESIVVAEGDLRQDGKVEVYTAPADGLENLAPLFTTLPAGNPLALDCGAAFLEGHLYFCAEVTEPGVVRLFRAPLDRATEPHLVSTGVDVPTSDVTEARVDPTGTWAIFRWDRDTDERYDLFRRRTDLTGLTERIHPIPAPAGADVVEDGGGFVFTPDGRGLIYVADHDVDEKFELYLSDGAVFHADFEWGGFEEWSVSLP